MVVVMVFESRLPSHQLFNIIIAAGHLQWMNPIKNCYVRTDIIIITTNGENPNSIGGDYGTWKLLLPLARSTMFSFFLKTWSMEIDYATWYMTPGEYDAEFEQFGSWLFFGISSMCMFPFSNFLFSFSILYSSCKDSSWECMSRIFLKSFLGLGLLYLLWPRYKQR